ncbi:hypothetical protein [Bifidobacterium psychraerophilum]|uniref:phage tail tube protein n=1 Tax=Bifidobacterium psychraerophilum TaxID=218140 RepID=UPI0039EB0B33
MTDVSNVSAAKPYLGGGVFVAPIGTALPTDLNTPLDAAFKDLGFVSDDGIEQGHDVDTDKIKAFGGATVLVTTTSDDHTYKTTFIETNEEVLKQVYGADAVTKDATTGVITVAPTPGKPMPKVILVFELLTGDTTKERKVVPNAQVSDWESITYKDTDAIAYGLTYDALVDTAGHPWYSYRGKIA